jgi:hypothetical protein
MHAWPSAWRRMLRRCHLQQSRGSRSAHTEQQRQQSWVGIDASRRHTAQHSTAQHSKHTTASTAQHSTARGKQGQDSTHSTPQHRQSRHSTAHAMVLEDYGGLRRITEDYGGLRRTTEECTQRRTHPSYQLHGTQQSTQQACSKHTQHTTPHAKQALYCAVLC